MPRRRRNSGPATWSLVLTVWLLGGGICLFHQVRLDREGRATMAQGVEVGRTGKGQPLCDYTYGVDGRTYVNRNRCVGLPLARVDYLPADPLESRLHYESQEGWVGVFGFGFFALVSVGGLVAALLENPTFWRF